MRMKKITAILLILCLAGCAGCKDKNEPPPVDPPEELVGTGIYLFENGASPYKIVVGENASENETLAAEELAYFFEQATGVTLEILPDTAADAGAGRRLYIGRNAMQAAAGVAADRSQLTDDGFVIRTDNGNVYILGATDLGTVYGVYEFLTCNIGFRAYADDEYYVDAADTFELMNVNVSEKPDFAKRWTCYYEPIRDTAFARRLRMQSHNDFWGLWAHSVFQVVPPEVYQEAHSDWYSLDGEQLCMTRDVGNLDGENESDDNLRAVMVENLKEIIRDNPDKDHYLVGQMDVNTFCTCEFCTKSNELYGGPSGTMMRFMNAIARDIEAWRQEEFPERNIVLATFAYHRTETPPVVRNAAGEYEAAHPSVIAEDNLAVMFAPLHSCVQHTLAHDECNSSYRENMYGWRAITGKLCFWIYSTNYGAYFLNINNLTALSDNYRLLKDEMDLYYLMDQGPADAYTSALHEMRVYVQSRLMWDTSLSVDALIDDFMSHYYKSAAPYVREYYDLINMRYAMVEQQYADEGKSMHTYVNVTYGENPVTREYWPQRFLEQLMQIFDRALDAVAGIEDVNERTELETRLIRESLSPRYLYLELYRKMLPDETSDAMADEFEADCIRCDIIQYAEALEGTRYVSDKVQEWKL